MMGAVNIQLAGDLDEATMKELADTIREEVVALPDVSSAQVMGSRPFEISIEISESTLRQYGLTLERVAGVIRQWSIDLPGGVIRSAAGDIRLRATGQAYTGQEFKDIVLLTRPDGTRIQLGDVATIRDGFAEMESYSFFDGKRSFGHQRDDYGGRESDRRECGSGAAMSTNATPRCRRKRR